MTAPKVLVRQREGSPSVALAPAPDVAWQMLGWTGLAFCFVGGLDVALTWLPLSLGNPEWEFGTITASLNGLPLAVMGLALVMVSAVSRGRRWLVRTTAMVFLALGVMILAAGVLYATDVPIALQAITTPVARVGLGKAMIKTASQVIGYPALFVWIAVKGLRHGGAR